MPFPACAENAHRETGVSSGPGRVGSSDLLVVVPTYNEVANVGELVARIESLRRRLSLHVLIVDDNSPDGTRHAVQALQGSRPWLQLLSRDAPSGLGSAYRAGFAWALTQGYSHVSEMDADLSHDPADLDRLYRAAVAGSDLVLGSRYVDGGGVVGWPLGRKMLSWGANLFARSLLDLDVRDVTAGFRIYSRRAIELLLQGSTECNGYGFQIESVFVLAREGFGIEEVPIVFRDRARGASKMTKGIAFEAARRCFLLARTSTKTPAGGSRTNSESPKQSSAGPADDGSRGLSSRRLEASGRPRENAPMAGGTHADPAAAASHPNGPPGFAVARMGRLLRLFRFALVGLSGLLVNQLVLWAATDGLGFHYLISAVLATQCSTSWNFALSEWWVFKGDPPGRWNRFFWFAAMNNAWLAGRFPFLFVLTEWVGLHYLASNLAVLIAATVLRFAIAEVWIWATPDSKRARARTSTAERHLYDIHGIARIASAARLPELEAFRVDGLSGSPDISIDVGNRGFGGPRRRIQIDKSGDDLCYVEHLGGLGFALRAHVGAFTRIQVSRMLRYSPHVLYTNVVEPVLRWLLVDKGYALVHGACFRLLGRGVLISAHTDTGKTTTCLRSVRAHDSEFLSDDMVIVSPDGTALCYPKPLTISAHTLQAARTAPLPLWRKALLQLQGRLHSRTGRRFGMLLGKLNLPVATLNGFVQMVVPPPKFFVGQLIHGVRVIPALELDHVVFIGTGPEAKEKIGRGDACRTLIANTEDAYGFPPYPSIADVLTNGKRAREERIYGSLVELVRATRLHSPNHAWDRELPGVVRENGLEGEPHIMSDRGSPRSGVEGDPAQGRARGDGSRVIQLEDDVDVAEAARYRSLGGG
jgi:dolichol-phosphate mannosyltransferase